MRKPANESKPKPPDDNERLMQQIAQNPAYRVMTVDGLNWSCPYTGAVLSAPFGCDEIAKSHLIATQPWKKFQLKTVADLNVIRWKHHLDEQFEKETRLKIFHDDGRWLNPY